MIGKKTGGRKTGTPNRRTIERKEAEQAAAVLLEQALPDNAFKGDAHAYLMAVYKNPENKQNARIDAAKAAMPYEKPRLNAVEHTGKDGAALFDNSAHNHRDLARAIFAVLREAQIEDVPNELHPTPLTH